ncbi:hypothetical protein RhiirA4_512204 [Rhizophagus irregularis]|uniref:Uncharacterized protein n=1 Tax=Rhizophagus irregularis TaxID=588596 RepID=A0A2I1HHK9_9GLOM|nr:hypothetical protein RhiirA4_512204 [Rhizophagus irregularis]
MSRLSSNIILDEWFNKIVPKPINNRPGYDMKYVSAYIVNYCYGTDLKKIIGIEWEYDTLSVVKPGQSLVAWAVSVRIRLQELLANQRFSVYHLHCLFAGFGNGKMVNSDYHRPRINKSNMAICFDCWKLVKITDIKPKKTYFSGWRRYGYEIKSEDLMKYHWDNECSKAKTPDGSARIIQRAYRNYKKQPETFAKRVWEAVRNDNTLKEKKFLNMPSRGIRCTVNLDIWYSIDGLYRPYHVPQDQLYDYISYSKHKRRQLSDRLAIARNKIQCNYIMPSAPNFEPACISITSGNQEVISPTSYQSSNCRSNIGKLFISSQYVKQPKGTVLRLGDGTEITVV